MGTAVKLFKSTTKALYHTISCHWLLIPSEVHTHTHHYKHISNKANKMRRLLSRTLRMFQHFTYHYRLLITYVHIRILCMTILINIMIELLKSCPQGKLLTGSYIKVIYVYVHIISIKIIISNSLIV